MPILLITSTRSGTEDPDPTPCRRRVERLSLKHLLFPSVLVLLSDQFTEWGQVRDYPRSPPSEVEGGPELGTVRRVAFTSVVSYSTHSSCDEYV